ncbi:MAG: N-acetylglucosamine-6-phosphate deacetylase [Planctomycetota bacterium]|nr:MAG: N-acetylglucosamine-6-phosphate deacetylase [Planctomycetota bacterium]
MAADLKRYVDLQVNGYVGIDFNDPTTSVAQLHSAADAMRRDGVVAALPTVITGSAEAMTTCIRNLVHAIEQRPETADVFRGIHVEGPFLSPAEGYIGAHPRQHAKFQDLRLLEDLCRAGGPWIRMVTLAPEVDPGGKMVRFCRERNIIVAAGHTNASLDQLECAIESGLSLFTHLGNGCPRVMDRHDNIIFRALRLRERLRFTVIADGFHIPRLLFENLLDWIPTDRLAVVSDAISAAGLGPGVYQLAGRSVTIGPDRACRDASGEHFVGSASRMCDADDWLRDTLGLPARRRRQLLFAVAAAWMGWPVDSDSTMPLARR